MIRTTITMDDALTTELDAYIERSGAYNRSEAIRDLVRRGLSTLPAHERDAACIGVVSYTIDQTAPGLAKRVRLDRLDRHDEIVSTLTVPINHTSSVDIVVMHGTVGRVNGYAQQLFLERGVKHGATAMIPVSDGGTAPGKAPEEEHGHAHVHIQESF